MQLTSRFKIPLSSVPGFQILPAPSLPFGPYGLLGQQVNSWPVEGTFPSGLQSPLAAFGEAASPIIPSPAHSDLCLFFFN